MRNAGFKRLWPLVLLVSPILVAWTLWLYTQDTAQIEALPRPSCDLHQGACTAIWPQGQGQLTLQMTPRPIPVMRPITLDVRLEGPLAASAQAIDVDFNGVDMDMGYNHVSLQRLNPQAFGGTATLPVCMTGTMAWRIRLVTQAQGQRFTATFTFMSSANTTS